MILEYVHVDLFFYDREKAATTKKTSHHETGRDFLIKTNRQR